MGYGADIGTMLTGVGVLSGVAVWIAKQTTAWREARRARAHRTWHGYIPTEGLDTWNVRVIQPDGPSGVVTLEVLDRPDGEPSVNLAYNMRIVAERDGTLSRPPTPEEFAFLTDLRRERGYGKGFPVRLGRGRHLR